MYFSTGGINNGSFSITNERDVYVMDQISNDAVVDIEAYNEIVLLPPTDLISYTANGSFHARIRPNSLDPVSYHANGWSNIGKWEKFEIGVSLPGAIDQNVEDFLNGINSSNVINPYDYDEIKLRGTYTNGSNSYERFGFYYRDIAPANNGTSYVQAKSNKPFRIRFAPNAIGYWTVKLELIVNGNVIDTYNGHFNCVDIGRTGPISIGPHNRFQFDDGGAFFPIGQDFGPLIHSNGPHACGTTMQPNDLNTYIAHIANMADNGGNFVRIPMDYFNFYIEYEEARVYGANRKPNENFARQHSAYSLDKVFDKIESRDMYSILLTETDQFFHIDEAYKCDSISFTQWPAHPYSKLSEYGINYPTDVFGSIDLFNNVYKKRIFYIHARYGYSPNLAVYEVCNEVDGIDRGSSRHYESNSTTRNVMYDWAVNTSNYMKSLYPYHMTTISYRNISLQDPALPTNPTSNPSFDIRSPHHYGWDKDVPATRAVKVYTQLYGSGGTELLPNATKKPVLYGEMGMSDEMGKADTCTDVEFHRGMWASGCSGAAGAGLYRYDYESDYKRSQNLPALHAFFDNMPFATDEFSPNDIAEPLIIPEVGVIYNVTNSAHKGYGWYYNYRFFWGNDPYLLGNCVQNYHSVVPGASGSYNRELKIPGFQSGKKYNVEFWRTDGAGGIRFQWEEEASLFGGKIALKKEVGSCITCEYPPDYGFKIYKKDGEFRAAYTDEYFESSKGDIYLKNDSIDWEPNGFKVTGKFDPKNSYHNWDFGNGKTSSEQYPMVKFAKPGVYNVTYSTLNSYRDTIRYHQTVYVSGQKKNEISLKRFVDLELVPNPSTGILNIVNKENYRILLIKVYDNKGALVLDLQENTTSINLSNHLDGLYNIVILSDQGIFYKKIIKIE
jgi:hypothetical protein